MVGEPTYLADDSVGLSEKSALRLIAENASDFISINSVDRRYLFVSAGSERVLGYRPGELLGRRGLRLVHPDDLASAKQARKRIDAGEEVSPLILRMRHKDGHWVWVELTARPSATASGAVVVVARDVSERKSVEDELHQAEERFRRAFEEAPSGMAIVDLGGHWVQVNQALCSLTGYDRDELTGRTFASVTHPDDRSVDSDALDGLVSGRLDEWHTEKRYVRKDGEVVWVRLSVVAIADASGAPAYLVSQMQDVTEERAQTERLSRLALHDALTGLPNRVLLFDRLETALARLGRSGNARVVVMFLDLNGFKLVNDEYGHHFGDSVLAEIGSRLGACVRASDTVARYGGDEFVIVCEESDAAEVRSLVRRIRRAISRPLLVGSQPVKLSVSIGVVSVDDAQAAPAGVIERADRAMYQSKVRAGRRLTD
ncbi:MAG TPA: PAS domain S-box protein [Acidimicrobiales bacterium]|nr:PAS domain S-box protein [Acidimicrobiales bacterium]